MEVKSPRIVRLTWVRVEVEGGRTFKDAILYPGGCQEWEWRVRVPIIPRESNGPTLRCYWLKVLLRWCFRWA